VLIEFSLGDGPGERFVDAVTEAGLLALGLPATYPMTSATQRGTVVPHARCQAIGKTAYGADEPGIACRSAAEAAVGSCVGEELALFDRSMGLARRGRRRRFSEWYPQAGG